MNGNRKDLIQLIFATLFAPVVAAAIAAALLVMAIAPELVFQVDVNSAEYRPATLREIATSLVGFGAIGAAMGAVLGWPTMAIAGLPAHGWLVRNGRTGGLTYSLLGVAVGTVTMFVYFTATGSWRNPLGLLDAWPLLLAGPVTGLLSAGLFWFIRRPDRIAAE